MTVQSQTAFDVLKQWLLRGSGKFAEAPGNIVLSLPWVPSRLCFTSFRTSLADWDDLRKGQEQSEETQRGTWNEGHLKPTTRMGKARELAPIPRAATIGALPEPDRLQGMSWEPTCSKLTYSLLGGPKVTATAALRGWGSFFLLHVSPRVVGLGGQDCSSRHGCSTLCRVRVHQWPCAAGTTDASRPLWADSAHQLALFACSSEAGASGVTGPKGSWAIWSWTSYNFDAGILWIILT